MKSTFAAAALFASAAAFSNSVPIYGTYPGWTDGLGQAHIEIMLFFDLLCSDCAEENPVINELMTTPWLNGTVADQIKLSFTPFPLPYHMFAFQVAQIVPYLMDLCIEDSQECYMDDYRNFCYANFTNVLSQVNMSEDEFIPWWTAQVAEALDLDQATLESLYGSNDPYNTNQSTRDFWKYGTSNGISGTPSALVNGVLLGAVPFSVEGWMDLLNTVYASQYHPTAHPSPIQN